MAQTPEPYSEEHFDWIQLSADLDPDSIEGFTSKIWRKTKENPFVPVGAFGAIAALTYGLGAMYSGNQRASQLAMRARIGAQGFAIASLIGGFIYGQAKPATSN